MQKFISILSTKKLLSYQKQALLDANFLVTEVNFITIKHLKFQLPVPSLEFGRLIFTSQNAVQSVLLHSKWEELKTKKVFCVGLKTKTLLEENGFNVEVYVDYASDLAEIITLIYAKENFIFFSGNLRKETLPKALKEAKVNFDEIQVYETILTPEKIKIPVDGILFFSPSAVDSYLTNNKIKNETCFCIGDTTANALEKITKKIIVANQPSVENVIEDVIKEYK